VTYVIWLLIGLGIAGMMGTGLHRQTYRRSWLAGVFGAVVGGVIGKGIGLATERISLIGIAGAAIGALIVCWFAREPIREI